ncbi:MAG: nucleotidyltransferase domain-containing protein [Turicibacter sp.]|nr:nucleotidyltransferase domain-containing protein [Turicibacter sp.]
MYSLDEIKFKVLPIAQKYGVEKMALFGSYARGEQHEESDLDFLIEKGAICGLYEYYDFIEQLEKEFKLPVDVMTYDALRDSIISDSIKEEVVLYEK